MCLLFHSIAEGDCWACGNVMKITFWAPAFCYNCTSINTEHLSVPRRYWIGSKESMEELMGRSVKWRRVAPDVEFRESV